MQLKGTDGSPACLPCVTTRPPSSSPPFTFEPPIPDREGGTRRERVRPLLDGTKMKRRGEREDAPCSARSSAASLYGFSTLLLMRIVLRSQPRSVDQERTPGSQDIITTLMKSREESLHQQTIMETSSDFSLSFVHRRPRCRWRSFWGAYVYCL